MKIYPGTPYFLQHSLFLLMAILCCLVTMTKSSVEHLDEIPPKIKLNYRYLCFVEDTPTGNFTQTERHLGIPCKCPPIYAPVCGTDNITYHNRCFMHCRAKHATDFFHRYRLVLKKFGHC